MTQETIQINNNVLSTLKLKINTILSGKGCSIEKITSSMNLVDDIGLTSLEIATLISMMDIELNVDPFSEDFSLIAGMKKVAHIEKIYLNAIGEHYE